MLNYIVTCDYVLPLRLLNIQTILNVMSLAISEEKKKTFHDSLNLHPFG